MLEDFRERIIHAKSDSKIDLICRIFLIEFFADFFQKAESCIDFECAFSKTDKNKVFPSDDMIGVSK